MARALIAALRRAGHPADRIAVGEPSQSQRELLAAESGVAAVADNAEAVRGAGAVVLAVKPQDMAQVVTPLRVAVAPERLGDAAVVAVVIREGERSALAVLAARPR